MLFPRLIPVLLVKSERLQKSEKFGSWKYVGDVLNAIKIFNEKDVDEVVVLDVDASRTGRAPDLRMLDELASECFMPLSYGGGISTAQHARSVMERGIEKVVLNSAAWRTPQLVTEISDILGSSSTVVSVDVVSGRKGLQRYDHVTGKVVKGDVHVGIRDLIARGAGEVLVQSKDQDGTRSGPALDIVRDFVSTIDVPLVYAGGVASLDDAVSVWREGASGVAAGAWFSFRGPHRAVLITYPNWRSVREAYQHAADAV